MFGRVGRAARQAAAGHPVLARGVLRAYNPETTAGVMAVGLGTAGFASGAALGRRADGTQVSALGEAVTDTIEWGRRQRARYVRLPGRVLVVVTAAGVSVHQWTFVGGRGRHVADWDNGSFAVIRVRYLGELGARITLPSGKIALLTGRKGLTHPATRATLDAIVAASGTQREGGRG